MGATFARLKVWVAWEVLTHTDLNAEFDNFLDNLTPAGVDDASVSVAAMRTTTDPYPGSAESQATSLEGEIQRLRYVIAQLSGKTYWYQDPSTIMYGVSATTISPFYNDTAPTGWTIQNTLDDKLLFVTKGSGAGGQTGGTVHSTGTWTQPNHTHSHNHKWYTDEGVAENDTVWDSAGNVITLPASEGKTSARCFIKRSYEAGVAYISDPWTSPNATPGATANTWRPAAYCVILAKLN